MSEFEIPDEAVRIAAQAGYSPDGALVLADQAADIQHVHLSDARTMLEAAYPSLRRAVLENIREDVAKALGIEGGG